MQMIKSSRDFVFLSDRPLLTSSLDQVLDYIKQCLGERGYEYDVYFKAKSILTELLTNGFKHAAAETVNISVTVDDQYITIEKTDRGLPFKPFPLRALSGKKECLTHDVMHNLYVVYEEDNKVRFIVEESRDDSMDVNSIGEHFGLLIITKCAEEFVYRYDEDTRLNSFVATVKR